MTVAVWAARMVLAGVFLAAAVGKLRDLDGTRVAVVGLGIPDRYAGGVTALLPLSEITAAVAVIVPLITIRRAGASLSLLLLAGFSVAIIGTLRAGRRPPCHCFGARSTAPLGPDALVRNAALALLAAVVLVT